MKKHFNPAALQRAAAQIDPNGVGVLGTLFGLPFTPESARVRIFPLPWEVTVSYGAGCARGPQHVLEASPQLDLLDEDVEKAWEIGIAMEEISSEILAQSDALRQIAEVYILWLEEGKTTPEPEVAFEGQKLPVREIPALVNRFSAEINQRVFEESRATLAAGQVPALLGGDHSSPLGLYQASAKAHGEIGILQIDAHADLRIAYEGFTYSHASIMYNALQEVEGLTSLVQVGVRDYCQQEAELAEKDPRIHSFYFGAMEKARFRGKTWHAQVQEIIAKLPQNVHVSFDIDGLRPELCPNTGTPVAGGLSLHESFYLLSEVRRSGRKIVSFDLCEVGPSEWDGNVGARVLYKLAVLAGDAARQGENQA